MPDDFPPGQFDLAKNHECTYVIFMWALRWARMTSIRDYGYAPPDGVAVVAEMAADIAGAEGMKLIEAGAGVGLELSWSQARSSSEKIETSTSSAKTAIIQESPQSEPRFGVRRSAPARNRGAQLRLPGDFHRQYGKSANDHQGSPDTDARVWDGPAHNLSRPHCAAAD